VAVSSVVVLRGSDRQPTVGLAIDQPATTMTSTTTTTSTTIVTTTEAQVSSVASEAPVSTATTAPLAPEWPLPSNTADLVERSVMILGTDGTGLRYVAPADQMFLAISPDGSRIVYFSSGELHVVDIDGANGRVLPGLPPMKNQHPPLWSPDGSAVAAVAAIEGTVHHQVWVAELAGGARLISDGVGSVDAMAWSPDSKSVAATIGTELLLLPRADGPIRKLTDLQGNHATTLSYSPNGQMLAYQASSNPSPGIWRSAIYVLSVDGSDHRAVADHDGGAQAFAWSADSTALVHKPDDKLGLVLTALDGSAPEPILTSEAAAAPAWSSKNQVLFAMWETVRATEIAIINADGSGRKTLVDDGGRPWLSADFVVSPRGDFIAFTVAATLNVAP
jgi:Tol biopolymer transport system component